MTGHPRRSRATRSGEAGFTLTEMLITLVVTTVILGAMTEAIVGVQRVYSVQQTRLDARINARATMDMITRLARTATTVVPDPDGNGLLDSIRLRADWNPENGVVDAYEDVTFTAAGNIVRKQEPIDPVPVPFADRLASIAFLYRDTNNAVIANPIATPAAIAFVEITVTTSAFFDGPGFVYRTSSAVRLRE